MVTELLPDLHAEGKSLLFRPSKDTREEGEGKAFEPLVDVVVAPGANFLVVLVLWPRVQGPFELSSLDVDETGLVDPFHEVVAPNHRTADSGAGFFEESSVAGDVTIFWEGAVVRTVGQANFLKLNPTAGLEVANLVSVYVVHMDGRGQELIPSAA